MPEQHLKFDEYDVTARFDPQAVATLAVRTALELAQ